MNLRLPVASGFFFLVLIVGYGQNLVPNPGFEHYATCPISYGELEKATPWFKPTSGSTDYFNACAASGSPVGVPTNYNGGYQEARSGNAYVGIATFKDNYPNYREYIEVQLTESLKQNTCYYFEMYVNKKNSARYASDGLGAHIRKGIFYSMTSTNLSVSPQIVSLQGQPITDTLDWVQVGGYLNATGGEDHLIIGNFGSDFQTTTMVHMPSSNEVYAFYYIDDISLSELAYNIELGNDTILCPGESITLDISLPAATYLWNDGSTDPVKLVSEAGKYAVTVSIGQCLPLSDSINVYYTSAPQVSFGPDTSICRGYELLLDAYYPHSTYLWHDGSTEPRFTVKQEGMYWIEVANPCGIISDTLEVEYLECHDLLFAPNAFTPNGDGINDVFLIPGSGIEVYYLHIYDRWGRMVHSTQNPGLGWDGNCKTRPCPSGVYHWVVRYTGGGVTRLEKEQQKSGFVLLLR